MHPDLRRISADAERAAAELTDVAAGLNGTQLAWSPAPRAWSIEQILDHIAISSSRYAARLGPVIGGAPRRALTPPLYRPGLIGRRLIAAERDPARRRTAPAMFGPTDPPAPEPLARAVRALAHLGALAIAADGLDVNRIRVPGVRLPLVRLSLGDTLTLAVAHATRHAAQARRMRDHPAFPI
jgi:hypothetical protein